MKEHKNTELDEWTMEKRMDKYMDIRIFCICSRGAKVTICF